MKDALLNHGFTLSVGPELLNHLTCLVSAPDQPPGHRDTHRQRAVQAALEQASYWVFMILEGSERLQ